MKPTGNPAVFAKLGYDRRNVAIHPMLDYVWFCICHTDIVTWTCSCQTAKHVLVHTRVMN